MYSKRQSVRWALTFVAGLGGFMLHQLPFEAVAHLMPGRLLTLPVAILFGPWFGLVAALVGAVAYVSVEPLLMIFLVAEAWLVSRAVTAGRAALLGGTIAWVGALVVIVVWPHWVGMDHLQGSVWPWALQHLLTGMVVVAIADLVALPFSHGVRGAAGPARLRSVAFRAFVLVGVVPVLMLSAISNQLYAAQQEAEGGTRLKEIAASTRDRIQEYVVSTTRSVEALAESLSIIGDDRAALARLIRAYPTVHPTLNHVTVVDTRGMVIDTSLSDADGAAAIRLKGVADREYFRQTIATRQTAISDVIASRVDARPTVVICAPFFRQQQVAGAACGILELTDIDALVAGAAASGTAMTVVDRRSHVIFARASGIAPLQDLSGHPLVAAKTGAAAAYTYTLPGRRAPQGTQLAAASIVAPTGWSIYLEEPLVHMQLQTTRYYVLTLLLIGLALAAAVTGARWFSRAVTKPLEGLVGIVRHVSVQSPESPPAVGPSPLAEVGELIAAIETMQRRLHESYSELQLALTQRERLNAELQDVMTDLDRKVRDRTVELSANMERYKLLVESTQAVPWEWDPQTGEMLYISPQIVSLTGYDADTLTTRMQWSELLHPDDLPTVREQLRTLVADRGTNLDIEYRVLTANRGQIDVRSMITAQQRADGSVVLRGTTIDITRQKKLEFELRQAQKLESVGRLAAGVAHEINTPVQFVSDSVHFARDAMNDLARVIAEYQAFHAAVTAGSADAEAAAARVAEAVEATDLEYALENVPKALDRSLDGLSRVATIVRSMKEFAHPDRKEMTPVDLNRAIDSTLTIARNEYKYVADVETQFEDIPLVTCLAGDINQAVLNVIVNAAHAIEDAVGGTGAKGRITVRTRRDGDSVLIAISDTGSGIPAAVRERIFDPFFTTKEVGRGTGQGLAIARSVVLDKHGGDLSFDTEMGKGTTFTIRLPIHGRPRRGLAA